MLHNKFVVVPIDKASNNVAFVCQRNYAQVFINNIGLNNVDNITSGYKKATKPVNRTESGDISFLKNKFNIEVTEINNKNFLRYTGLLNSIKTLPKQVL